MKTLLLALFLAFPLLAKADDVPAESKRIAHKLKKEFRDGQLDAVAYRTDQTLDGMIARSAFYLRDAGDVAYADAKEQEWKMVYSGYLGRMTRNKRHIGDHAPLIQWLAEFYDHVEGVLGVKVCKMLHISDIKSLNFAIPIVFHPCDFPMDAVTEARKVEYKNHFSKDDGADELYGLAPVLTYWIAYGTCMGFTYGTGVVYACGFVGDGAEWFMAKFIAPPLSDFVFSKQCE